jgi:hypothetical protein
MFMSVQEDLAIRRAQALSVNIPELLGQGQVGEAFRLYTLYNEVIRMTPGRMEIVYMRGASAIEFIGFFSNGGLMHEAERFLANLDEMSNVLFPNDMVLKDECAVGIGVIIMGYFIVARDLNKVGEWYSEFLRVVAKIPRAESSETLNEMISTIINNLPPALTMNMGLPRYA